MKLLVIRHAIAEEPSDFAGDDRLRPLTDTGRQKMREAAAGLRVLEPRLELLVSSPLLRAVQTAEIVARAYGDDLPMTQVELLAPGGSPEALLAWLASQKTEGVVAVVGHEPSLSEFVSWLLTGRNRPFVMLKKGSACRIDLLEGARVGAGLLLWLAAPAQLRKIGA